MNRFSNYERKNERTDKQNLEGMKKRRGNQFLFSVLLASGLFLRHIPH